MRSTTIGCAAIALVLAGCGGGGGSTRSTIPSAPVSPPASTEVTARATFILTVPTAASSSQSAMRSPRYVSAATQSITVAVTGPNNATASTTVNISSCSSAASGTMCTITVLAPVGADTFTVTTYDAANGSGNVLSTGSSSGTVVADQANTFPLVLGGTPAKLAFSIVNAYLPVVDGGKTAVTLSVKDAGGNEIVGTYATPVTVGAASGLLLGTSATAQNAASLQIAGSSAASFFAAYDGKSRTSLPLSAAAGSVTGTGSIVPTTHEVTYAKPAQAAGGSVLFKMVKGPDGALYFADLGAQTPQPGGTGLITATSPGWIGRLDPATGAYASISIAGIDPIGLLFVGNNLYIAEQNTGSVGKIANAAAGGFTAANYSQLKLPNAPPTGTLPQGTTYDAPRDLAYAGGKLYVTCLTGSHVAVIDPAQWGTAGAFQYYVPTTGLAATGSHRQRPHGIAVGKDGNLYVTLSNFVASGEQLSKIVPGAQSMTDIVDTVANNGQGTLRFIATGPDGNLYITWVSAGTLPTPLTKYDYTTFSALAYPAPASSQPDSIKPGSGSTLVFSDLNGAVGVYDTASQMMRLLPASVNILGGLGPNDVVDGGDGSYWFTLYSNLLGGSLPNVEIGHVVLAQGWQVLPESSALTIDGSVGSTSLVLGVAESASSHDSVTVASTTPSVCSVIQPAGYSATYVVSGLAAGSCVVKATDQNNRVVTVPITVTTSTATISSRRRITQ